jgi:BTB/POZ domain
VLQLNGGVLGVLSARMATDSPKQTLKFPDLSEAVLKKLLEFCYTLRVSAIHKTPFELLLAAHRYDIKGLQALAEKDVARCIDLANVLDLHVWNESLLSGFLSNFISFFFSLNYAQIRQLPEFEEKLTADQQAHLDKRYGSPGQQPGQLSQGFLTEDEDDGDSGLENDGDEIQDTPYEDGQNGPTPSLSVNGDQSSGQEEANLDEPDQLQLDAIDAAHLDLIVEEAQIDQAAVIAQMFGDLEGLDPDALDFLMMLL